MSSKTFEIITTDKLKLHGRQWEPDTGATAVVCVIHGLGEHSGRYEHVADAFIRSGFAVFSFDLRGHGLSEGKRGHSPSYARLMSDIFQCLEIAKEQHPDLPQFLYGQSLGGNLAIHYVLRRQSEVAGVIASSPLFRPAFTPPAWKAILLRALAGLCPSLTVSNEIDTNALSQDADVVQTYKDDPLVHDRISLRLAKDMLTAGELNHLHAANIPCPMLLMHGESDRITSVQASREFAALTNDLCTFRLWPGLFHELHNEPQQQQVLTRMSTWIKLCLATAGNR
jgi:alpha-beta hydrolase superfamily lysophospholipase